MSVRIAHIYETGEMEAKEIAHLIATRFAHREVDVEPLDGNQLPEDFDFSPYDGLIIGASARRGRFPRFVETIIEDHLDVIEAKPSAFYSVSQIGSEEPEEHRERIELLVERFLDAEPWRPVLIASFVGKESESTAGFLMALRARGTAGRRPSKIDLSSDYEYIRQVSVEEFVARFDARLSTFQAYGQSHRPEAL